MISDDLRHGLLEELKVAEKRVRADLLAQYRTNPALMARAMQRLADEESSAAPGDRSAWLETFAGRGAVLYILKTLYVRVLEDQGLLSPVRLRDGGTYALFRSLFPQLGHAAYLRRVFDDAERALPDLFAPTPIEIATPSGEAATAVWNVWQLAAPGGGPRFDFRGELDTRFIGDLYQDLDPDVKARYALLQTPRFIEEFILDRTFEPALAEVGIDDFRIIDPTCGSGHFLLGAFERLVHAWRERLGDVTDARWIAAERALGAVYGADLNEYACALSRFRLLLAIVKATGETEIARLRTLHANVIACDSLIPWERAVEVLPGTAAFDERFARYGTADERARNAAFFARGYHAVVGNPPYISVKDKKKREDYRRAWPRSAIGRYSLSAPMTERFMLMPLAGGHTGLIVAKNFSNREFGKGLIEQVLPRIRLELIIDTSGASIPGHATPTVMLFARNVRSTKEQQTVVVASIRGGPVDLPSPESGPVWQSTVRHFHDIGFQNEWITVHAVAEESYHRHPWTLASNAASVLLNALNAFPRLHESGADAGPAVIIAEDEAFVRRYARALPLRPIVLGDDVRDWRVRHNLTVLSPIDVAESDVEKAATADLWPLRTSLWARPTFGGQTYRDRPNEKSWWQFHQVVRSRITIPSKRIAIGEINSNSQFAYDDSDAIFTRAAPVLTLIGAGEEHYRTVAAVLNSSILEFWFKSRCAIKNGWGEPWEFQYVRNSTNVLQSPTIQDPSISVISASIDKAENDYEFNRPASVLRRFKSDTASSKVSTSLLARELGKSEVAVSQAAERLVGLQEELDWHLYSAFGLLKSASSCVLEHESALARGHRPFEIALASRIARGEEDSAWFERHGIMPVTEIPNRYVGEQRKVLERRLAFIKLNPTIDLLEQPVHKRRWSFESWDEMLLCAVETYLLELLEALLRDASSALTEADLVTQLANDSKAVAVAAYAKSPKDAGFADTVSRLLADESIPDNPARLLTASGLEKLVGLQTAALGNVGETPAAEPFSPGEQVDWKRVWRLQEREDAGESVATAVPRPFVRTDYSHPNGWRIRGKFNVANERFIVFDELSPKRYAWGGHTVGERARLSAEAFDLRGRQAEPAGLEPPSVQPTRESPVRCGIQFPLWDKLDELRRSNDPGYADVRDLAELCGRTCPCDVLPFWRETSKPPRGKRKPASPAVTAAVTAPDTLDADLLDRLFEAIRNGGPAGLTAGKLEPVAAGDRILLRRALDALRSNARVEANGSGRGTRYRVATGDLF